MCCVLNGFTVEKRGVRILNLQVFPLHLICVLIIQAIMKQDIPREIKAPLRRAK